MTIPGLKEVLEGSLEANVVHIRLALADGDEVGRLRSGGNNWYKIFNLVDKVEDANVALPARSLFQMKGRVNSDFMIWHLSAWVQRKCPTSSKFIEAARNVVKIDIWISDSMEFVAITVGFASPVRGTLGKTQLQQSERSFAGHVVLHSDGVKALLQTKHWASAISNIGGQGLGHRCLCRHDDDDDDDDDDGGILQNI